MFSVPALAARPIRRLALCAAALSALPALSHAQGAFYGEAGAGELTITELGTGDVNLTSPLIRGGFDSGAFWFVEGEALFGSDTGSRTYVEVSDATAFGVFAGAKVDFSPQLSGFARIGAQQLQFKAANTAALSPLQPRLEYDATLAVAGVGAVWNFDAKNGLRFDATLSNEAEGASNFFSNESGARTLTLAYRRTF